jgi:hypothetical protein
LSGAGFELDVALLLQNLVAIVTPEHEAGSRGKDYDIHLQVYGLDLPVEVKAKDDDTPYTPATVVNTLKVPRGIFLKAKKNVGSELSTENCGC